MVNEFNMDKKEIEQEEEKSLERENKNIERCYPLNKMRTTVLDRLNYDSPGFNERNFYRRIERMVKEIHAAKPSAIILSQTKSANRGFLIKEAFSRAYPYEKCPPFLTTDVQRRHLWGTKEPKKNALKKMGGALKKYGIKNGRIIVLDDFSSAGRIHKEGYGDYHNSYLSGGHFLSPDEVEKHDNTLKRMGNLIKNAEEDGKNEILFYNSPLLYQWREQKMGPWFRTCFGIKPHRVKGKSRRISLDNIKYLKEIGRKAGQKLHEELEGRQSLEQKVISVIAISGFLGSLLFLQSNITGNAIANLSTNATSWIGGVLLAVGLIAGFFWIKSKKENPIIKKNKN